MLISNLRAWVDAKFVAFGRVTAHTSDAIETAVRATAVIHSKYRKGIRGGLDL